MRSQALGVEVERKKLLLIRVVTVGTVWIGKCALRAVKIACNPPQKSGIG